MLHGGPRAQPTSRRGNVLLILREGAANGKLEEAIISLAPSLRRKVAGLAGPVISDGEIKAGEEEGGRLDLCSGGKVSRDHNQWTLN